MINKSKKKGVKSAATSKKASGRSNHSAGKSNLTSAGVGRSGTGSKSTKPGINKITVRDKKTGDPVESGYSNPGRTARKTAGGRAGAGPGVFSYVVTDGDDAKSIYAFELVNANGDLGLPTFHLLETINCDKYAKLIANATWKVVRITNPKSVSDDVRCLPHKFIAPDGDKINNPPFLYE